MNDKFAYEALWAENAARVLAAANEKYKGVARIRREDGPLPDAFYVYDADGYLHYTLGTLEDAIEACKWLDNAKPADRQI